MTNPVAVMVAVASFAVLSAMSKQTKTARQSRVRTVAGYARNKLPTLRQRAQIPALRAAWESWGSSYLPGVPYQAFVALTVSSQGPAERVPAGLFGVERQRLAEYLLREETTRRVGVVVIGDYPSRLDVQALTGMIRLREALRDVRHECLSRGFDPDLRESQWGSWEYHAAIASYSSGQGTTAKLFSLARSQMGGLRSNRWTRVSEALYEPITTHRTVAGVRSAGLVGAAWTLVRPQERYESGRLLAERDDDVTGSPWWTDTTWPDDVSERLFALAHRRGV